jgi:hypothetical protein
MRQINRDGGMARPNAHGCRTGERGEDAYCAAALD